MEIDVGLRRKHLLLTGIPESEVEVRGTNRASQGENASENDPENESLSGNEISKKRCLLNDSDETQGLFINEDLPPQIIKMPNKKMLKPNPLAIELVLGTSPVHTKALVPFLKG